MSRSTRIPSRKRLAPAFGALVVLGLALAGCVRFQADLSVDSEDRLDGDIVVAVITGDQADSEQRALDAAGDIEARLLPALRGANGVTAEPYAQDDYVGTRFTLEDTPISALDGGGADGALRLTRDGEEFEFRGILDVNPDDAPAPEGEAEGDPQNSDITVSMRFPGEVLEHNGELSGTTVTWTTTLEGSVDMHARASAVPTGPDPLVVGLLVAGGALLVALIVVLAVVFVRRRGSIPTA